MLKCKETLRKTMKNSRGLCVIWKYEEPSLKDKICVAQIQANQIVKNVKVENLFRTSKDIAEGFLFMLCKLRKKRPRGVPHNWHCCVCQKLVTGQNRSHVVSRIQSLTLLCVYWNLFEYS